MRLFFSIVPRLLGKTKACFKFHASLIKVCVPALFSLLATCQNSKINYALPTLIIVVLKIVSFNKVLQTEL